MKNGKKYRVKWSATATRYGEVFVPQSVIDQGEEKIAEFMSESEDTQWSEWDHDDLSPDEFDVTEH